MHVRAHRPRPVERDERSNVFERGRRERAQQRAHRPTFELEHADGVAASEHLERRGVVERNAVDVGARARRVLDQVERDLQDVEVAQPEEVDLEQPEIGDAVHLVLGDDRRVLDLAAVGLALDREVLGERLGGDDDRGRVDAVLAPQALEPTGDVEHACDVGVGRVDLAEVGRHLVAVLVAVDELEAGAAAACHDP